MMVKDLDRLVDMHEQADVIHIQRLLKLSLFNKSAPESRCYTASRPSGGSTLLE